eukprot:7626394-Alexandrium_andersonii.AAC.1
MTLSRRQRRDGCSTAASPRCLKWSRVRTARSRAAGCCGRCRLRRAPSLGGGWASHVGGRGVP